MNNFSDPEGNFYLDRCDKIAKAVCSNFIFDQEANHEDDRSIFDTMNNFANPDGNCGIVDRKAKLQTPMTTKSSMTQKLTMRTTFPSSTQ